MHEYGAKTFSHSVLSDSPSTESKESSTIIVSERTQHVTDQDRISKLRKAVCTAQAQFAHYANLHERKGTPESREKARVNADLAEQMEDVLEETKGPKT